MYELFDEDIEFFLEGRLLRGESLELVRFRFQSI